MHRAERSDICVVLHNHVAGERRAIGENRVAADDAIVGDVGIRHEEITAADPRHAAALRGAAAHRGKFPKTVRVTHHEFRALAAEFQVLRISADGAKRIENVFAANPCWTADHGMRRKRAAVPQLDVVSNHGERTDP